MTTRSQHKPWLTGPGSKKHRLSYFLTLAGIFIGLAVGAYLIYTGFAQVPKNNYCQVLGDSFSGTALDESVWQREVIAGGNDVDDFVWSARALSLPFLSTSLLIPSSLEQVHERCREFVRLICNSASLQASALIDLTFPNSFVSNGNLWIVPTFTNESSFGSDLRFVAPPSTPSPPPTPASIDRTGLILCLSPSQPEPRHRQRLHGQRFVAVLGLWLGRFLHSARPERQHHHSRQDHHQVRPRRGHRQDAHWVCPSPEELLLIDRVELRCHVLPLQRLDLAAHLARPR